MADIFISYARTDRGKITKLAAALEAEGYSVWWDRQILGGAEFSKDIERELEAAKVAIVAWSKSAAESTWVKDEAIVARDAGKLIPISLDATQAPLGFKQFHSIEMATWNGDPARPGLDELLRSVRTRIRSEASVTQIRKKPSSLKRFKKPALLLSLAMIMIIIATGVINHLSTPRLPEAAKGAPITLQTETPNKSIAVLPFADMSEAGDQEYFSDGVAEEVLNALVKIEGLHVAGRTSSFMYKGDNIDLREVGRTLNVTHILEGSVRKQGEKVRITAQLVKAEDGFHLWSETYDGTLDDIFDLQEKISKSISREMQIILSDGTENQPARILTGDKDAYDLFLKGRDLLEQRLKEGAIREGVALLKEAVALDPNFAEAWASYAEGLIVIPDYELIEDWKEGRNEARRAARKAISLNPDLALAHGVLSLVDYYDMNFSNALAGSETALALAPDNPRLLLWRGAIELALGNLNEAASITRRAANIDPLSDSISANYARLLYVTGNFDEAERVALRNVKLGLVPSAGYVRADVAFARGNNRAALQLRIDDIDAYYESQPPEKRDAQLIKNAKIAYSAVYGGFVERSIISSLLVTYASDEKAIIPDDYMAIILGSGRWEEFLKRLQIPSARYSVGVWEAIWDPYKPGPQTLRQQVQFRDFIEEIGMAKIWREHGWPDLCRPLPETDGTVGQWECD